jgi:guanylate kinase
MEQRGTAAGGRLVVVSGPSGVGKGTMVAALRARRGELELSVSATTRPQRPGETDGVQYHFLDRDRFDAMAAAGGFLEWAEFNGHRYGTPAAPVLAALEAGRTVLLEIEVQGARQVKERVPEALLIFLQPPDKRELERRLHQRGTESAQEISERLGIADAELASTADFDRVVVNEDLDEAVQEILRILDEPSSTPV